VEKLQDPEEEPPKGTKSFRDVFAVFLVDL